MSELAPTAPVVVAVAERHGFDPAELIRLLSTPEAKAILATAEHKAAELINDLPSRQQVTLDAATHLPIVTPGWKTSEFWFSVFFFAAATLSAAAGFLPHEWAAVCDALSVGFYSISRGQAKRGSAN